jgi:hypothetical protein
MKHNVLVLLESISNEYSEWGIGIDSSNPELGYYIKCGNKERAKSLLSRLNMGCQHCGSLDWLVPTDDYLFITCDPCGKDIDYLPYK